MTVNEPAPDYTSLDTSALTAMQYVPAASLVAGVAWILAAVMVNLLYLIGYLNHPEEFQAGMWIVIGFGNLVGLLGLGMILRAGWVRYPAFVLSCVNLIGFPLGTFVGVCGLFALIKGWRMFGRNQLTLEGVKAELRRRSSIGDEAAASAIADSNALSSSPSIGSGSRVRKVFAVIGLLLVALILAAGAVRGVRWWQGSFADVWLDNGTGQSMTVSFDGGKPVTVLAYETLPISVWNGDRHVQVIDDDGNVISEQWVEVQGGGKYVLNPTRAQEYWIETAVYTTSTWGGFASDSQGRFEDLGSDEWLDVSDVDVILEPLPETVDVKVRSGMEQFGRAERRALRHSPNPLSSDTP